MYFASYISYSNCYGYLLSLVLSNEKTALSEPLARMQEKLRHLLAACENCLGESGHSLVTTLGGKAAVGQRVVCPVG